MRPREQAIASRRLSTQFAVFALLGLTVASFATYLAVRQQEEWLAHDLTMQRASEMLDAAEELPFRNPWGFVVRDAGKQALLPVTLRELAPGYHVLPAADGLDHVVVSRTGEVRVYAVYGDHLHRQRTAWIGRILAAIMLAVGAAVLTVSTWWAGRLVARRPSVRRRLARRRANAPEHYARAQRVAVQGPEVACTAREFIANVGHELRTPITVVMTSCELLGQSDRLEARDRAQVDKIAHAAKHMSESVRSFMILARDGDFGRIEPVELRSCMLEVLEPHRAELEQRGLGIQLDIGAEVTIEASREAALVVLGNLLGNAIKYTDAGGISIQFVGRTLHVSDTGCGIQEPELANIFMPFYRSRGAAESGRSGLGLGLTIVKRICDFYEWPISVSSRVDVGTTISIEFPRTRLLFR